MSATCCALPRLYHAGSEREARDQGLDRNLAEAVNAYLAAYPTGVLAVQPAPQPRQQLTGYEINLGGLNIRLFPGS